MLGTNDGFELGSDETLEDEDGLSEGVSDGDADGDSVGDVVGIAVLTQRGRSCNDRPWPPPLQLSPCQLLMLLSQQ